MPQEKTSLIGWSEIEGGHPPTVGGVTSDVYSGQTFLEISDSDESWAVHYLNLPLQRRALAIKRQSAGDTNQP